MRLNERAKETNRPGTGYFNLFSGGCQKNVTDDIGLRTYLFCCFSVVGACRTGGSRLSVSLVVAGTQAQVDGAAFTFRLHRDLCVYGGGQPWQDEAACPQGCDDAEVMGARTLVAVVMVVMWGLRW